MARATRSTTQQEKDKPLEPAPPPRKPASKKRKRTSLPDGTDQPAVKQQRTDDPVKQEGSQEPDDTPITDPSSSPLDLPSSGDVPIQPEYAEKILDVLEVVDTQGLLDRVFPLPTEQEDANSSRSSAGPSSSSRSYSFRALLKESAQHPLRVLRSAVQHLFPISSHPRSRPSAPAAEQLRFCNLALSLLDQASLHSTPIPLDVPSIIAAYSSADDKEEQTQSQASSEHPTRKKKYALVQKLSSGDWWTSTNSTFPSVPQDGKEVTDLSTAHADLVAIFPTPSSNVPESKTLGAYAQKIPPVDPHKLPRPRQICCGKFLDYGPYASFAPTFEQNGMEVGRVGLGEFLFQRERKRRLIALQERVRAKQLAARTAQVRESTSQNSDEPPGLPVTDVQMVDGDKTGMSSDTSDDLGGLLSSEQVASIKSAVGNLELEAAVEELLARNTRALEKLDELQKARLGSEGGGSKPIEAGSEEWETAQSILESLTVLTSLRPRSSADGSDHPPLIPTASALQKLHCTLPVGDTGAWHGTLPPARASALRDDTTVRIEPGTSTTVAVPVVAPPATPAPPKVATTPSTPQPSYPYASYTTQYRGGYGTYAPTQTATTQYYSNQYQSTSQQPTQAAVHYPNAQYGGTGQHQYAYAGPWYNYQTPALTQPNGGTSSGRATPQPATAAAGNFTFYNSTPQPQRAVANTVLSAATSKPYQQGQWQTGGTANPHIAPTLPLHLRGVPGGTPSTPAGPYQSYYSNPQATPSR